MGEEYSGKDLAVFYNTLDISGKGRRVKISEKSGEPKTVDITHKGDTRDQSLELRAAEEVTTVDYSCLDEAGGDASLLDFAINAKDTLKIYPEGRTHSKPELVLSSARLISRDQPVEYDKEVELSAQFHSRNSLARGTYSTV